VKARGEDAITSANFLKEQGAACKQVDLPVAFKRGR